MSPRVASRRWWLAVRLAAGALVWSVGLVLAAVLVPAYGSDTSSGAGGLTLTSSTLLESKGAGALVLVTIPALASLVVGIAMVSRRRDGARWSGPAAWTAIGVVTVEALLGILSVGGFMLPVAVLLALAVRVVPPGTPAGDAALATGSTA
jgi:hypothetical protein